MVCSQKPVVQANPKYTADVNMSDVQAEVETLRANIRQILAEELPRLEAIGKAGDTARFKETTELLLNGAWNMLNYLQERFRAGGEVLPLPEKIDAKSRIEAEHWLRRALAWLEVEEAKFFGSTSIPSSPEPSASQHIIALLSLFSEGVSDDRILQAADLLANDELFANEKLTRIDKLIPFPPTASAEKLGKLVGVSKQAVMKTDWWKQNRQDEKKNQIGRRKAGHAQRAASFEDDRATDDDDDR